MAAENNQESIVSHLSADTDSSTVAIHHTLGPLPFQASPGSHRHDGTDSHRVDYNSLLNLPTPGEGAGFTSTVKHMVKNASGVALTAGQVVYITGADGTNMLIGLADADADATSATTIGLLENDLAINGHGYVVTEGLLAGINTTGATAGDPVWLSSTPGGKLYGLANKPYAPAHLVYLGVVTRVNSNNGEIFVSVNNGWELDELHNVLISTPVANNEVLAYDSTSGLWINQTASEAGLAVTGHTHDDRYYTETETDTLLSGKSNTGHTHVVADVTGLSAALDAKAPLEGWTVNRVLVANGSGAITASTTIDTTELGYLNGVTANIQTSLDGKVDETPIEIGNAIDLNTFTTTGFWTQSSNAEAAAGTNYPAPYAGLLEVAAKADASFIYQRYTTYQLYNRVYHRSNYLGTWSLWREVSNVGHAHSIADVTGLATSLAGKADTAHTHTIANVTGLQTALDSKATGDGYTVNRVLVSNGAGVIAVSPTIDTTELGYLNGVTSDIQTQLNNKAAGSGYTASRALISDASGNVVVSPLVSTTELDYLDGVTSNIQTQLNGKSATGHTHITSEVTGLDTALAGKASTTHTHAIADVTSLQTTLDGKAAFDGYTASSVLVSNSLGAITASTTINTTELGYLNNVTSNIQTQLDGKDVKDLYRFETSDNLVMSSVGAATTASIFGTNGVAVEASTAYLVEGVIYFTAGVVGTSATHSISWGSPSSPATVTRNTWLWNYNSSTTALANAAAMSGVRRPGTTSFQPLNTITMTGTHLFRGNFYGIVEFNAAGNFTPRITVTPTSASVDLTINVGSYIKLKKLGTTNTNGTWA